MVSYYKIISKIRNITFIFQNFEKNFWKQKKCEKFLGILKNKKNLFEIKKGFIGQFFLPIFQ